MYSDMLQEIDKKINQKFQDGLDSLVEDIDKRVRKETEKQSEYFNERLCALQSFCADQITRSTDFLNSQVMKGDLNENIRCDHKISGC